MPPPRNFISVGDTISPHPPILDHLYHEAQVELCKTKSCVLLGINPGGKHDTPP